MIINMVPYFAKDLKFACGIGCPRAAVAFGVWPAMVEEGLSGIGGL